ncbi:MAG: DNRLRE domain-containing protein [Candidatus Zixiibacteriota bacterium]
MKKKMILLSFLFLLAFSVIANSAFWEASVTQVATISPNQSSDFGRLLFRFDLPDQLNGVTIDYAELVFTATADTGESYICLMGAYPLTKSWEPANISWSEGWTTAGGDFTDTIYTSCLIGSSTERLTRIDITDIVQMWVQGTISNYGLIVMPLEDSGRFLKLHTNPKFPPNVKAKVRIFYTTSARE